MYFCVFVRTRVGEKKKKRQFGAQQHRGTADIQTDPRVCFLYALIVMIRGFLPALCV